MQNTEDSNITNSLKRHVALIDMDGILYDSMKYHSLAWYRLAKELGIPVTKDEFYLYEGMTGADTLRKIWSRVNNTPLSDSSINKLYAQKSQYFLETGEPQPMPGANRMLRTLEKAGWKRVLVTGSGQRSLLDNIDIDYPGAFLPGLMVTAHDVVHGKPNPEPYLKGMEKVGVTPEECIVIENAPLGVRAGKKAGCLTIAVTTGPIPKEEFEKENADFIFQSMESFADFLPILLPHLEDDTYGGILSGINSNKIKPEITIK